MTALFECLIRLVCISKYTVFLVLSTGVLNTKHHNPIRYNLAQPTTSLSRSFLFVVPLRPSNTTPDS